MKILIDTITMTWKYDNLASLIEQIGLTDVAWEPMKLRRYDGGQYYDGVVIGWNYDEYGCITDTFLDVSGKGCRTIEQINDTFDWFKFINTYDEELRKREVHISRIDVACDLEDDSITMKMIHRYSHNQMYICKSKCKSLGMVDAEEARYFGSKNSDRRLRIYDKALEMGIPDTYWLRFEFQLRNDNATSFYLNWCEERDIGKLYAGIMIDYIRFVQIPRGWTKKQFLEAKENRHQGRLESASWWKKFIGDAERIKQLYLPKEEYTLARVEHYLEHNAGSNLKTYIIAHDGSTDKLIEAIKHAKLNVKQKILLTKIGKTVKEDYEYQEKETKSDLD